MSVIKHHYFQNEADWLRALEVEIERDFLEITSLSQVVALAGGSTPEKLYTLLGQQNRDHICFTLTDERLTTDPKGLNATLLERTLFKNTFHPDFINLSKNYQNSDEHVQNLNDFWRHQNKKLFLVILGMGEDGHFASLFPPLEQIDRNEVFIAQKAPLPYAERISLSFMAILKAQKIILALRGKVKKEIIEVALLGKDKNLPISLLLAQRQDKISIFWAP